MEFKFKGGEIKDVSDITKGRTMTQIRVENVAYQKSSAPELRTLFTSPHPMKSVWYMNHRNKETAPKHDLWVGGEKADPEP